MKSSFRSMQKFQRKITTQKYSGDINKKKIIFLPSWNIFSAVLVPACVFHVLVLQKKKHFYMLCVLCSHQQPREKMSNFSSFAHLFSHLHFHFYFSREAREVHGEVCSHTCLLFVAGKGTCTVWKMFKLTRANITWLIVSIFVVAPSTSMLLEELSPGKLLLSLNQIL